jgi:hypothetical protein
VFSPVGDQFLCGATLVTVSSGTVLEREHVRELGSGLSQVIVIETPNDVILTDEEGNAYRLVGTARGNFVTAADPEDEFALESGFFAFSQPTRRGWPVRHHRFPAPKGSERQPAHSGSGQLSFCVTGQVSAKSQGVAQRRLIPAEAAERFLQRAP